MNNFDTTYILSAELANLSDNENFTRTEDLERKLKLLGIPFKCALGCFKGKREVNFVLVIKESIVLGLVKESIVLGLVKEFNQSCALVLDSRRNASLLDGNGTHTPIGKFKVVPEDIALRRDNWTFDNVTNQYFVVE